MAEERGHRVAARTWRDLAEVAAHLLGASPAAAFAATAATWRASMLAALRGPAGRL